MKKSLIALAVMAASGAAMAQSSVTLYGIVDVWFGTVKTDNGVTSLTQTVLDSGGVNTSRWGLKGSEDLGGGLKANFDLQAGFDADTGAGKKDNAGNVAAFARQSWVGLSGGFGATRFGRTTTAFDDVSGASNGMFDSAPAPMNVNFKSTKYVARPDNTIYYQAPDFSGFSGAISYSLGEDKTATVGASSTTSLNLTYGAGPVAVQFGYQKEDTAAADDLTYTRLGGSFDFGAAKVKLVYGKAANMGNVNSADATEYQLGVDVPVSAAMTVSGSYARSKDNATAGDAKRSGYGLAAAYTLSKRTFLYAAASWNKTEAPGKLDAKTDFLALGLQHRF